MDKREEILDNCMRNHVAKMLIEKTCQFNEHNGINYLMVNQNVAYDAMSKYATWVTTEKDKEITRLNARIEELEKLITLKQD